MKSTRLTHRNLIALALLLVGGHAGAQAPSAINPPPSLMNFQGRLANSNGTPVVDGNAYSITLSLWDAATGGTMRWSQNFTNVSVHNGTFALMLNLGSGFASGNNLDTTLNNATYLQVKVGTDAPLTPRQQLVSNAYSLKAGTVADGSITASKLSTDVINSLRNGAAGGDLTGMYPSPLIRTDVNLLNKVSGTLLTVAAATTALDQQQLLQTAVVTSSAWQSFKPGKTGTLVEIDVFTGTTGAPVTTTLSLYAGRGTGSTPLQTIPITVQPGLGMQTFPITAAVTLGTEYTWAIGSNNSLSFGYTGGTPYANGVSDLGTTFDYAFQTIMRDTAAPATQILSNAGLFFNSAYSIQEAANVGPMIVKQYNPFTSGTYNGIGRFGLFMESNALFMGMPGPDILNTSMKFGTWSPAGTRSDIMTLNNGGTAGFSGNVGIGNNAPQAPLHVTSTNGILVGTSSQNGGYTALNLGLSAASGGYASIQAVKSAGSAYGDVMLNPNGGNVGIGTTSTAAPLSFAGVLGEKISLWGTASANYGFGVQGGQFQIHSDTSSADVLFGYGSSASFTETMRVKGTGAVGIGTNSPASGIKLDVNGKGAFTGFRLTGNGAANGNVLGSDASGNASWVNLATSLGAAGGDLTGTYPSPTIAANAVTFDKLASDANSLNKVSNGVLTSVSGRIGINNTGPLESFHLIGTARFDGRVGINQGMTDFAKLSITADSTTAGQFECINGTSPAPNGIAIVGVGTGTNSTGVEGRSFGGGFGIHSVGRAGGNSGWENSSDARFKKNVQTFPDALETILALRGVTFDWKRNDFPEYSFPEGQQVGFIAQELEKVLPQLVNKDAKGYRSVVYANVVPVLVEAVKTLKADNDRKDARIDELDAKVNALQAAVKKLLEKK